MIGSGQPAEIEDAQLAPSENRSTKECGSKDGDRGSFVQMKVSTGKKEKTKEERAYRREKENHS